MVYNRYIFSDMTTATPTRHSKTMAHPSKRSKAQSFCLRLARSLDRYDHRAQCTSVRRRQHSRFLRLPPEIRQEILNRILDDEDLGLPRPNTMTRGLPLVCCLFREDMVEVRKLWDARQRESELFIQPSAFSGYIADLMAPVERARAAGTQLHSKKRIKKASRWNAKIAEWKTERFESSVVHSGSLGQLQLRGELGTEHAKEAGAWWTRAKQGRDWGKAWLAPHQEGLGDATAVDVWMMDNEPLNKNEHAAAINPLSSSEAKAQRKR